MDMKKKYLFLCFLIITMVSLLFSGTVSASYDVPTYVRIGIYFGNSSVKAITVESSHGFYLGSYHGGREFASEKETSETKLKVSVDGAGVVSVATESGQVLFSAQDSAAVKPRASGKDQKCLIDGVEYRGAVDCMYDGVSMTVANVVYIEHYLYSVVSREMSPSWPLEALKAQAVCARNYVVSNLDRHQSQGFDLCTGVHCQTYSGTNVEGERSYQSVDETQAQLLTYDGAPAELYYAAAAGPRTEDVKYVWGYEVPYLLSVDNAYEDTANVTNGYWNGLLTCDEATAIMRNKGYDVGDVTGIKVLEYTPNGRVLKLEVSGTAGSKVFERESCRTIFNTITKSQMFSVTGDDEVPSIWATDGDTAVEHSMDKLVLLTASGRVSPTTDTIYATNGVYQQSYTKTEAAQGDNSCFYFEGTGWGHGVGMSQYGAKGMAEAGFDYQTILLHYFPGTNLENVNQ